MPSGIIAVHQMHTNPGPSCFISKTVMSTEIVESLSKLYHSPTNWTRFTRSFFQSYNASLQNPLFSFHIIMVAYKVFYGVWILKERFYRTPLSPFLTSKVPGKGVFRKPQSWKVFFKILTCTYCSIKLGMLLRPWNLSIHRVLKSKTWLDFLAPCIPWLSHWIRIRTNKKGNNSQVIVNFDLAQCAPWILPFSSCLMSLSVSNSR